MKKSLVFFVAVFFLSPVLHAAVYSVSPAGSDSAAGSASAPWFTLQHAADEAGAGDTVLIKSGTYAGFRAEHGGASNLPITFKADTGASVLVNTPGPENVKGSTIEIENCDWWVLEDLEVTGAPSNAGIDIRVAGHVTVKNCFCHHNERWGVFTGFVEYFAAEYNECSYSVSEHGIYHSNSGDNAVIRYNVCHHNAGCGIQINADPSMGGDGISSFNLITDNVLFENGALGGAAINLASVRDTLVANNLIFSNHAGGIAAWDDGQGEEWGSMNNKYYNNTVHMPSDGRWAISLANGSTGAQVYNNILIHENSGRGGLETDSSSLPGLSSNYNVISRVSVDEISINLSDWQFSYSQDTLSASQTAAQTFITPGIDYHLLDSAWAKDHGVTLAEVTVDLEGNGRPQGAAYDIGSYETAAAPPPGGVQNGTNILPIINGLLLPD